MVEFGPDRRYPPSMPEHPSLDDLDALFESLRHPSPEEIEEMRRIGAQPGACGVDEDGNLEVVQGPPERPKQ